MLRAAWAHITKDEHLANVSLPTKAGAPREMSEILEDLGERRYLKSSVSEEDVSGVIRVLRVTG